MPADPQPSSAADAPSARHRAVVAAVVGVLILSACVAAVVFGGALTEQLRRSAALGAAGLLLYLTLFQVGLATGLISGRRAWGGQHATLPPALRRASAVTAALLPVLAWVLLERARVVDLVGADGLVGGVAWGVVLLFLVSTAGNLASDSRVERQLGIPVPAALVVLSFVVAYGG